MAIELKYNPRGNGFSLIELIVVIVIISIFMVYAVPKIGANTKMNLNKTARKIAGAIIYTRNEAIFKNKRLRLRYNIDEGSYSIKELVVTEEGLEQVDYAGVDDIKLEDGIAFMDVVTSDGITQTLGEAYTHFFNSGMVESTLIHLKNDNDQVKTLEINVLTGEVDIHDDYYDGESI